MLHNTKDLESYSTVATDGAIGSLKDFYFDDEAWTVRYLVVDTSVWLPGRKVLISPMSLECADPKSQVFSISLSKEQVKESPNIDTQKPVSRQHELRYFGYYGYPYYWGGSGVWGQFAYPGMLVGSAHGMSNSEYRRVRASAEQTAAEAEERRLRNEDSHLRSCNALNHYHVHATDGDIGHVDAFLVDEHSGPFDI